MKDQQTAHQNAYKQAGVDIDEGDRLVKLIGPAVKRTSRPGTMGGIGGFGACFDLKATGYNDPVLVSATDGVGTKLRIAIESGIYDTVGIDLVAMCANDLVVQGAEPLFFLDYFATGKLDADKGRMVIEGIAQGCMQAGCALIGGETAEMPGMYQGDDFDLAGFCVGAVERDSVITGADIAPGDVVLGLGSSGLHSNGFSLVRKIIADEGLAYVEAAPFDSGQRLGHALLAPTRIYVRSLFDVLKKDLKIKGLAHITGGGLLENIPRILPDGTAVALDAASWPCPPVFGWLAELGGLDQNDMARTLNCGIGMTLICDQADSPTIAQTLRESGEQVYEIGRVEDKAGRSAVEIENLEMLWN